MGAPTMHSDFSWYNQSGGAPSRQTMPLQNSEPQDAGHWRGHRAGRAFKVEGQTIS